MCRAQRPFTRSALGFGDAALKSTQRRRVRCPSVKQISPGGGGEVGRGGLPRTEAAGLKRRVAVSAFLVSALSVAAAAPCLDSSRSSHVFPLT